LTAVLVLDPGGVTRLAERSRQTAALILALREQDLWLPFVPSVVLVACLQGHPGRDALADSFLKTCDIVEDISEPLARRAALLRTRARRGSASPTALRAAPPFARTKFATTADFSLASPSMPTT